jgi:hypothetical protein
MLRPILFERKVLHRQPELGQDLGVRNSSAASVFEPGVGSGQRLFLLGDERLIINRSRGDGSRDGV